MVMNQGTAKQVLLSELIRSVSGVLLENQYSAGTIESYRMVWRKLQQYFDSSGEIYYQQDTAMVFLRNEYGIISGEPMKKPQVDALRKVQVLEDYYALGDIMPKRKSRKYDYPDQFKGIFENFIEYRHKKGYSARRKQSYMLYLERFGEYLSAEGIEEFSEIKERHLIAFAGYLSQFPEPTMANTLSTIKSLLVYAFEQGVLRVDLSKVVPKSGYRKNRPLPSAYSREEVERVLKAVDRSNPVGKRDYAILMLAAKLGIRAGDIVNLKLSDLKWDKSCVEFIQEKTEKAIVLPILDDVGEAIIDYLKNGRPKTDKKNVFVVHRAPFHEFTGKCLHHLVKKHILSAGIKVKRESKLGPHSLRHSLASALLEANTPLPVISEVLGHTNSGTTGLYLKIGISQLRKCALEVPHATS
jgi:site-specific recombinase XerD